MHENFTFRGNHHYIKGKSIFLTRMKNSNMIVRYMLKRLYKTNLCHEFCINENNSFLQIMFCDELDLVEFLLF